MVAVVLMPSLWAVRCTLSLTNDWLNVHRTAHKLAKHHGGRGPHAELVGRAMHIEPVVGQAFQAGDLVAHFVVEDLGAAAGNGIQTGIAQAAYGVLDAQAADLSDADNLRRREAVQMHLREALLDTAQQGLVP